MVSTDIFSQMPSSLYDNRILVVDDTTINRELISSYLKTAGYRNIVTAVDGEDALEKIKQVEPDLLILDLVMPKIDGTEVIKILRNDKKTSKLPILVQTMISDPEQRKEAWAYGATDIITKPIHKLELLSRVKVQLQNSYLIRTLEGYQRLTSEEITRALDLQKTLLPSTQQLQELSEKYDIKVDSLFLPSRFLSGDMWGIYEIAPGKLIIWICDFSGKGISASLLTFRLHTLFLEYRYKILSPTELIRSINNRLKEMIPIGHFCTCLIGLIDLETKKMSYVSASATHPLVYYPNEQKFVIGDGSGIPLGISSEVAYETRTLEIPVGSSLVLYSDLLWEDIGAIPGISFLPEKLPELIYDLQGRSMLKVIKEHIHALGETSFSDDLTLIELSISR
ncbi:PP2C family protein-serine/threonine phosphatase [Candidatus Paracaedibacter symbiosus]|uniref:PP2C family protein-serine/threonine phosphatase n=1 Tax=Candidatus Paracaedibacter symbiosus TaxID=244582 RepID=UPI000690A98A|nr:fused response regulator/phosphatase [Candidatus Paracaedibacter symbiosus]